MKRKNVMEITTISLFVAVMAVSSQIAIPTAGSVPITIQSFVIALAGYFLGSKKGLTSVFIYILVGLVGAPVFANFQGGFYTIVGYTGGYILGFLPFSFLCGIAPQRRVGVAFGLCGLLLCNLMGTIQYSIVSGLTVARAFTVGSLLFLPKDIVLTICAYYFAKVLKKKIKQR